MKKNILKILRLIDLLLIPMVYFGALVLKAVRRIGVQRLPYSKNILLRVGVFPLQNHYYEPRFDYRSLRKPLSQNRFLPGINWNANEQLKLLRSFTFSSELTGIPSGKLIPPEFSFGNGAFESGDAEYWYQIIRLIKPKRIIEIGSGSSTLMAIKAIARNTSDDPAYRCEHICIEPYEQQWLEQQNVMVIRQKVEEMELAFFNQLDQNDILFIDSSHIITPQGDVLFEYLELLPLLNIGVIVHVHDIFSPKDYLERWIVEDVRFWNEQYLLEAFLSHNNKWKIVGALNYLKHNYYVELESIAPYLTPDREPGSFYMQRIG